MKRLRVVVVRFLELLTRRRVERELQEEVQHHLDLLAEDYERHGLSSDDARAAARRSFGSVDPDATQRLAFFEAVEARLWEHGSCLGTSQACCSQSRLRRF